MKPHRFLAIFFHVVANLFSPEMQSRTKLCPKDKGSGRFFGVIYEMGFLLGSPSFGLGGGSVFLQNNFSWVLMGQDWLAIITRKYFTNLAPMVALTAGITTMTHC